MPRIQIILKHIEKKMLVVILYKLYYGPGPRRTIVTKAQMNVVLKLFCKSASGGEAAALSDVSSLDNIII